MLPFHNGPIYKWLCPKTLCKATNKGYELEYIGRYLQFYVLPNRLRIELSPKDGLTRSGPVAPTYHPLLSRRQHRLRMDFPDAPMLRLCNTFRHCVPRLRQVGFQSSCPANPTLIMLFNPIHGMLHF